MKFLLGLLLFHVLSSVVYAKAPFIHFGRCVSNLSEKAHCLPIDKCEYYQNETNPTDAVMCNNADGKKLVCCPKTIPVVKMNQLLVEPTAKPTTTEKPKTTQIISSIDIRSAGLNRLPEPPSCGLMLSDRIYGGNETQLDEYPWMALLEYRTSKGREFLCGGSLINDRWVLTAAHCILYLGTTTSLLGVRLGEWNTETDKDCITTRDGSQECADPHIDMAIDRQLAHPLYDNRVYKNDIALLRMAHPITPTQYVKPVCLPTRTELRTDTFFGSKAEVSGWGKTEHNDTRSSIKLKARLDVLSLAYCRQKYAANILQQVKLDENQMCAGGVLGIDSCGGDSGGPLVLELPSSRRGMAYYQIGIVSFGNTNCGGTDTPGVYTRVGPYIDWIGTTIGDNQN